MEYKDFYSRPSVNQYQQLQDEFKMRKQRNSLGMQLKQAQIKKMNQPDPFDPKQAATVAIYKKSLGQPLSPEDEAAIRTMSTIEGDKTSWEPNEYGQIVARTQPNPYSTVLDPVQASQQAIGQRQQEIGVNPNQSPRSLNDFSIADLKNMNMADMEAQLRGTPVDGQQNIPEQMPRNPMADQQTDFEMVNQNPRNYGVPTLGDTGPFFNTPAGNIETGKAKVDVQKAGDMLPIEVEKQRQLRQVQQDIPTSAEQLQRDKFELELQNAQAKSEMKQDQLSRAEGNIIQDMGRAIEMLEESEKGFITGAAGMPGAATSWIPGTPAYNLDKMVESAKSNISIQELQAMRESSPTGGALGQVPVQQQEYLMQLRGSLQVGQKPDVLKENMKRVWNTSMDIVHGSPQEISQMAAQGAIDPERAEELSFRYPLSFDEFGRNQTKDDDIQSLIERYSYE